MIMKKLIWLLIILFLGFNSGNLIGQENISISQKRKDNLIKLLNYRYKGGFLSFEKKFNQCITYPPNAIGNCIMGIAIVSFRVSCEGEVYNVKIKTPLGYGIGNEISSFFAQTSGNWNPCHDDKYSKFEVPIQFKLTGTETNTDDALLVVEETNPGYLCNSDEYYIKKMEKYMKKGKYKRAIQYIDILMRRDPYNSYYYEQKKKAVNGGS
jgi:hypothetical protein